MNPWIILCLNDLFLLPTWRSEKVNNYLGWRTQTMPFGSFRKYNSCQRDGKMTHAGMYHPSSFQAHAHPHPHLCPGKSVCVRGVGACVCSHTRKHTRRERKTYVCTGRRRESVTTSRALLSSHQTTCYPSRQSRPPVIKTNVRRWWPERMDFCTQGENCGLWQWRYPHCIMDTIPGIPLSPSHLNRSWDCNILEFLGLTITRLAVVPDLQGASSSPLLFALLRRRKAGNYAPCWQLWRGAIWIAHQQQAGLWGLLRFPFGGVKCDPDHIID